MKTEILNPIFRKLNLGEITTEPESVAGGLIHLMWKVTTADKYYAVKQLNPLIIAKPDLPETYILSEKMARSFSKQDIPAVSALFLGDSPLIKLDGNTIMIYSWIAGEVLPYGSIDADKCRLMGQIMGRIHALDLHIDGLPVKEYKIISVNQLQELIAQANDRVIPWAFEIPHDLPLLIELINNFADAIVTLKQNQVIGHRDMDVKNIIWPNDDSPQIIDWESVGLTNPTVELLDSALDWSGQWTGHLNNKSFCEFLTGYRSARNRPQTDFETALSGCYAARIDWLEFNMRRSLDEHVDMNERFMAENQVTVTLNSISNLHKNSDKYRPWFSEIIL